jgi:UDP-xylose/UDP-N-acetylglucosamine transporter B4
MLSLGVVISCFLGVYQQFTYEKYGKHWQEGLYSLYIFTFRFYNHVLALPLFALMYKDISRSIIDYNNSDLIPLGEMPYYISFLGEYFELAGLSRLLSVRLPFLWWALLLNNITQCTFLHSLLI